MKIKKDDNVIVITGKDKGKTGKVVRALPRIDRVVVEGLNIKKVHTKSRQRGKKGQIVETAMPMHVSNVKIVDSKSKNGSRVGYSIDAKGVKTRIAKKSKTALK